MLVLICFGMDQLLLAKPLSCLARRCKRMRKPGQTCARTFNSLSWSIDYSLQSRHPGGRGAQAREILLFMIARSDEGCPVALLLFGKAASRRSSVPTARPR
jgi:hypothetical protein